MKTQLTLLLITLLTVGVYAQHDHAVTDTKTAVQSGPVFKEAKVGSAYQAYLKIKDALVGSNNSDAKKAAAELVTSLTGLSAGDKAASEAKKIAATSNLQEQRTAFTQLSKEMTTLVKASKLTAGELYVEYCPMANNNQGGFWLSNEKAIRNPYFGDMMLTCGSVKETVQ